MASSLPRENDRGVRQPSASEAPNYWVRRFGALLAVGVVGYAGVAAFSSLAGGEDDAVQSASDTSLVIDGGESGEESGGAVDCSDGADTELCDEMGLTDDRGGDDGAAADADAGAATAGEVPDDVETTEAGSVDEERTGPPTPSDPAQVYIVGDSDAGAFAPYLETLLDGTLVTETSLNYKSSSGLARPDFFNWPEELAAELPEVDPDIVVVTFGGNDSQALSLPQPEFEVQIGDPVANEEEWAAEYERRVGEVMDLLLENDRAVIWVGIPNDDNADVTERLAIQDQAVRAAVQERPEVEFVDTWARFSGRDGGWAEFVVDPRDNEGKDVRADDGFHLNENGAEILAIDIAVKVQDVLREMGADL